MLQEAVQALGTLQCGTEAVDWVDTFVYLGNATDGGAARHVHAKYRVALASKRFRELRRIWRDKTLSQRIKMKIYKSDVCSIVRYGAEAWRWDAISRKMLNGFNAKCLTTISVGKDSELNYGEMIRKESILSIL